MCFLIMGISLLRSLKNGAPAPADPWKGATLEWTHTASPPITENFDKPIIVTLDAYERPGQELH